MRPLELDDVPDLASVVDLALSPDGSELALVLGAADEVTNRERRHLMRLRFDGRRGPGKIVGGGAGLGSPRWSPDGARLAFVDDRGGTPQLWSWDRVTRVRTKLTDHPTGVADAAWSPDGNRIAFIADGARVAGDPVPVEEADPRRRVRLVQGHRHKLEGRGWLGEARHQCWLLDLADGSTVQLTDGDADAAAPAWSPDGRSIALTADGSADRDRHFGGEQIHLVDVATRNVRRLTAEGVTCANPAWSPDSTRVAYLRSESPFQIDGHIERLWVADVATGDETAWTSGLDRPIGFRAGGYRTPSAPVWTRDGAILQLLADGGSTNLARFTADGVERLTTGSQVVQAFSASADRSRVAILRTDALSPSEPWLWEEDGAATRRLWSAWPESLSEVERVRPEPLTVTRPEGIHLDAWLTMPPGTARPGPDGRCPLILSVHGGPHNAFGEVFSADVQLLAAAGYGVLQVNPRGSGGYGEAFGRAVVGDWGGQDLVDLLSATDHVLAEHDDRLDPARTAIVGGSYGGFMSTLAVTRTDRFTCAVAGAPVTWFEGMLMGSDIGPSWNREEFGGWSDERAEHYDERSPLRRAADVTTPLLLYHGEADLRVPIAQSEAFLTAVTAAGGDIELLRVPEEGHVLPGGGSPVHARAVRTAVLAFLERWLFRGSASG